jgi:hypothetical protein
VLRLLIVDFHTVSHDHRSNYVTDRAARKRFTTLEARTGARVLDAQPLHASATANAGVREHFGVRGGGRSRQPASAARTLRWWPRSERRRGARPGRARRDSARLPERARRSTAGRAARSGRALARGVVSRVRKLEQRPRAVSERVSRACLPPRSVQIDCLVRAALAEQGAPDFVGPLVIR